MHLLLKPIKDIIIVIRQDKLLYQEKLYVIAEESEMNEFMCADADTPRGVCSSVHLCKRFIKAKQQYDLDCVDKKIIIEETIKYLKSIGIELLADLKIEYTNKEIEEINYNDLVSNNGLSNKNDIVWMKFTKKKHHLGVVATSADINFDFPMALEDYDKKDDKGKWLYNSSGILVHSVGDEWDKDIVLVFPLPGLIGKGMTRNDIETGIGNNLIDKGVPIIDYYSHNY